MGVRCTITTGAGILFGPSSQCWLSRLLDTSEEMNATVGQSMIMKIGPGLRGPVTCSGVIWKIQRVDELKILSTVTVSVITV